MRVYSKVSEMAAWNENCKLYSSLPLGAAVSLFRKSSEFCRHSPLSCFSTSVYFCKRIFHYRLSPETFGYSYMPASSCTFYGLDTLTCSNLELTYKNY